MHAAGINSAVCVEQSLLINLRAVRTVSVDNLEVDSSRYRNLKEKLDTDERYFTDLDRSDGQSWCAS